MCNHSSSLQLATYSIGKLYPLGCSVTSVFLPVVLMLIIIFQTTWPQFDISPGSQQSHSVIALILLCLVESFLQPSLFLFGISHIFDKTIKSFQNKGYYTPANEMQCTTNTPCMCVVVVYDLMLMVQKEPAAHILKLIALLIHMLTIQGCIAQFNNYRTHSLCIAKPLNTGYKLLRNNCTILSYKV